MKNMIKTLTFILAFFVFALVPKTFASEINIEKISSEKVLEFMDKEGDNKQILMDMTYNLGNFILIKYDENYDLIIYDGNYDNAYKVRKSDDKFLTFWDDKEGVSSFMKLEADTKTGRAYGFIDAKGKVVIEPKWELTDKFFGGVSSMGMFGDSENYIAHSLIDKKGNILTDKTYAYIDRFMMPNSYESTLRKRHFFNIFESDFLNEYEPVDYAFFMQDDAERYTNNMKFSIANAIVTGGKKGLMDKRGNEIFPPTYDAIQVGDNDVISVSLDGKWGYVNTKGEVILPLQYEFTSRFRDGVAAIVRADEIAFIDKDFNIVQDFKKAPKWKSIFGVGDIDGLKKVFLDGGEYENISHWARSDVYLANSIDIVDEELQKKYKSNITREEFCEILVLMMNNSTRKNAYGKESTPYYKIQNALLSDAGYKAFQRFASKEHIFSDTESFAVEVAYEMGIVSGTSATTFSPNAEITRQEAAVMLMRAYSICRGEDLPKANAIISMYNDASEVADWASGCVRHANEKNIMKGVGNQMFAPKANYTVEQSIATIIRLYEGI